MYNKAIFLSLVSTALALHGSSHSHLEKRFTFPIPSSKGSVTLDEPKVISGNMTFDGGMKTYGRGVECTEGEGGDKDAVFWIQNGGTLKNVIIGSDQLEGVHCMGACTIENVWWEAVCEGTIFPRDE
jgi:pectate lyase